MGTGVVISSLPKAVADGTRHRAAFALQPWLGVAVHVVTTSPSILGACRFQRVYPLPFLLSGALKQQELNL